jgi:hypothetical protein
VQKNVLQVQANPHIRGAHIEVKCVATGAFQLKLANYNRVSQWCVDAFYICNEAFLSSSPQNPVADAVGNDEGRERDGQECQQHYEQADEQQAILWRHRVKRKVGDR